MGDSVGRKREGPVALAELLSSVPAVPVEDPEFERTPGELAERGRVAGFEHLRNELLRHWRVLHREYHIPLAALLKLVLETDRHILFAQLATLKLGDADSLRQQQWRWFREYLRGEHTSPVSEEIEPAVSAVEPVKE